MAQVEESSSYQDQLRSIQEALAANDLYAVRELLSACHPSEAADLLESLPAEQRDELWVHIAPEAEGDVLSFANDTVRAGLLAQMDPEGVAAATEGLDADDVVDILQDLPEDKVDAVLAAMDEQDRDRLAHILSYPEDTAGGLMNPDTVTLRADVSVDTVLRYLRLRGELPRHTDALVVVDRVNTFLGVVPMTTLVTVAPELLVVDIMELDQNGIRADTPATEVALIFEQRDLVTAPVIDDDGKLLGHITIDDVLDVVREQGEHSLLSMAGLDEEDDIFAPIFTTTRRRALWLAVNLGTAFLAAWVIGLFEATIDQLVALAILMPIVASMGGIAGSQTLTIVIRGLALGQLGSANARILVLREIAVGTLNGMLWALVVAAVAAAWFQNVQLGAVIAAAMLVNLVTAAIAGAAIPLLLKRVDIDPALAGGVILTTVTDVIGFFTFLGLAALFLV